MKRRWFWGTLMLGTVLITGCDSDANRLVAPARSIATPSASLFDYDPADGVASVIVMSKALGDHGRGQGQALARETGFQHGLWGYSDFALPMAAWLGGPGVVHGEVAHVGRGCPSGVVPGGDAYLADPNGKIALIERGTCTFLAKAQRAELAGAIAVIVYNTPAGGDAFFTMELPAGSSARLSIPMVGVGRRVGLELAAEGGKLKLQDASFKVIREGIDTFREHGYLTSQQAGSLREKVTSAGEAAESGDLDGASAVLLAFEEEAIGYCQPVGPACATGIPLRPAANILSMSRAIRLRIRQLP